MQVLTGSREYGSAKVNGCVPIVCGHLACETMGEIVYHLTGVKQINYRCKGHRLLQVSFSFFLFDILGHDKSKNCRKFQLQVKSDEMICQFQSGPTVHGLSIT